MAPALLLTLLSAILLPAAAEGVSDGVIPHRSCWQGPLTHSIVVSVKIKADWQTALTRNRAALARVNQAIDEADTAISQPNRRGCSSGKS